VTSRLHIQKNIEFLLKNKHDNIFSFQLKYIPSAVVNNSIREPQSIEKDIVIVEINKTTGAAALSSKLFENMATYQVNIFLKIS
jgi:hypothetical protein